MSICIMLRRLNFFEMLNWSLMGTHVRLKKLSDSVSKIVKNMVFAVICLTVKSNTLQMTNLPFTKLLNVCNQSTQTEHKFNKFFHIYLCRRNKISKRHQRMQSCCMHGTLETSSDHLLSLNKRLYEQLIKSDKVCVVSLVMPIINIKMCLS